jgi:hypothetical protein
MPIEITARLSNPISEPDLSKMWESERTTFNAGSGDGIDTFLGAPELAIVSRGNEVHLSFPAPQGGSDGPKQFEKMKAAFERAVHRYRPDVRVDWAA